MGNLPTARTENCVAGAAVSHNLLNEIQDVLVATYNGPITLVGPVKFASGRALIVPGAAFVIDTGAPTRSGNVWTFPTSGTNRIVCGVELPLGAVISSIVWSFNRNSTPITGDLTMAFKSRSFGDGGITSPTVSSGVVSSGSAWTTHDLSADGGLPHTVAANTIYQLSLEGNNSFSGSPLFDAVKIVLDRA